MATTIENILKGHRKHIRFLRRRNVTDVGVQRHALFSRSGLGGGQRNTKDGVGAEFGFFIGAVELDQEVVYEDLVLDVDAGPNYDGADDGVYVVDGH